MFLRGRAAFGSRLLTFERYVLLLVVRCHVDAFAGYRETTV